nr:aspartic peptidase [Tanacetum cinerariifolium]
MTKIEKAFNERPQGAFPSNTIPNPREDIKVITTLSGITLAGPSVPSPNPPSFSKEVERDPKPTMDKVYFSSSKSTIRIPSSVIYPALASKSNEIPEKNPHQPHIPYPSRLNKDKLQDKSDIQIYKFLQMFKKLHFNISFAEVLAQMPKYAKMLKDLLPNKEKLLKLANTPLNENYSAVLLKKLPEKLRDLGKFLIPCVFSELQECMTLADLGAIINLMPVSIWKKLMLPELIATRITLELANMSVAYPASITEDVFVQVGKFMFPADFVVVDYDTDAFLALDDLIPPKIDNGIYDLEGDILFLKKLLNDDPIKDLPPKELKNDETKMSKSSIEEPPELELKNLPPHLEYAFLKGTSKLPVIIAKDLKKEEYDQLIKVLKLYKRAIAWKISDIRGIDPNFCTHNILMEDDFKPVVQHQRRVNPKIHEVIKAEVIKLLAAELIYPILDSPWVSPVHVVPKKGGMNVVTNDNNELILTRLVT